MANSNAVLGTYDKPMWESMEAGQLKLQCCDACRRFRYPPASHCPHCLGEEASWKPITGGGNILSWVVFRRQYFDDFPAPYISIAVQLDEGPIVVTQLLGAVPDSSLAGARVKLQMATHAGRMQHHAVLDRDHFVAEAQAVL